MINFKKLTFLFLFVGTAFLAISQKIIGYIPQYRTIAWMDGAVEWDKMTDYYYFGSLPTSSGGITIEQQARFDHVLAKGVEYNKNVWLSVGGWGKSANFITVANSASLRQNFANEALRLCQLHGLKGVDIDWEFPSYGQETAFKNFFKTLYETLNPAGYLVSAAAGGEAAHADKWLDETFNYIDDLNIMSYDAPATYSNHASLQFMKDAMDLYHAQGCPYEKMLGGVAFYSRCAGVAMYSGILNGASNKQAAYENDLTNGYCYNGRNTIEDKIDYVMGKGGIGILIWEVTQDVKGQYSLLNACDLAMDPYTCSVANPDLGSDVSICGLNAVTLDGGVSTASGRTFTWKKDGVTQVNQNASATTYSASSAGTYTLEVWENGCSRSDEIIVTGTLNSIDLGGPYDLCSPVEYALDAAVSEAGRTIQWYENNAEIIGETGSTIMVNRAGDYKVVISASGCNAVQSTAIVTSSVPFADDDTVCTSGLQAELVASESVDWFASEVSASALATGTTYNPVINNNTTFWIAGSGAAATNYTTMKSAFGNTGWAANQSVYANKLTVETEITIDAVSVDPSNAGTVVVNLVESDGVTVVKTKTFNSVSGLTELSLGWTGIQPGTYYLNCVGTTVQLYVDPVLDASNYSIPNVVTVDKNCFADWDEPYGDAYQASTNYGNFVNLKVTAGAACDRVPVDVVIDASNSQCLTVGVDDIKTNELDVYPNPTSSEFIINSDFGGVLSIVDIKGALVYSNKITTGQVIVGDELKSGVYFARLQAGDGISVVKIVKK